MLSKLRLAFMLVLLPALVVVMPAFAGGWAVITLDDLPTDVVAGEPLTIGFTVLQHGRTPMNDLAPIVSVMLGSEEKLAFRAEADAKPGHYTATLTFPREGNWEWSIQAFTMDQPMPALTVVAAETAASTTASTTQPVRASPSPLWIVRVLAFASGLAGLILAYQRKSRLVLAVTVIVFAAGLASFAMGSAVPGVAAQAEKDLSSSEPSEAAVSQVERGRQLFIAKGCITCHYNDRAGKRSEYWTIEMGAPDLSRYSSAPEILFIRLKDPAAAKSDTQMPNLGLKETEIEALIAFINSR